MMRVLIDNDLLRLVLIAAVVYSVLGFGLNWVVPLREGPRVFLGKLAVHLIGVLIAAVGSFIGWSVVDGFAGGGDTAWWWQGPVLGAVGALFLVVHVVTPSSSTIVIHTGALSRHELNMKDGTPDRWVQRLLHVRHRPAYGPWLWPYTIWVRRGGSVLWCVEGPEHLGVYVRFPPNNTPFALDANGEPRHRLPAQGCARAGDVIVGAPVETGATGGRGSYEIVVCASVTGKRPSREDARLGETWQPHGQIDPSWWVPGEKP